MPNVIQTFAHEADRARSPMRRYYEWGKQIPGVRAWRKTLDNFLLSTMDEVRMRHSQALANLSLKIHNSEDAEHFRSGVLRREASGNIAFPKQRDHSAHTVNNWLLGWYIYGHSRVLRRQMDDAQRQRGLARHNYPNHHTFGGLWQSTSLLHDIGYLFEGSVEALNVNAQANQASVGARVVADYFMHRYWIDLGILSREDRRRALGMAKVQAPRLSETDTLAGIAHGLRELPDLERLRVELCERMKARKIEIPRQIKPDNSIKSDAFDLWKSNYSAFGNKSMAGRIGVAESEFYRLINEGLTDGMRILDHGVCSGLVLLMYHTFHYCLYHGLPTQKPADDARLWRILKRTKYEHSALYWWGGLVWASASAALHNILQTSNGRGKYGPLAVDEDPLTYLGLLVDTVQEWDRYTVSRASMLGYSRSVQGVDVGLDHRDGKVVINFGRSEAERARKVRDDLSSALIGWDEVVLVLP
jgi:hypothetical protein